MKTPSELAQQAAAIIKSKTPQLTPKLGLILGSGLGDLANQIQEAVTISYKDLPGFTPATVAGHAGNLVLGKMENYPVACLQGRAHLYEGASPNVIVTMIRTLKLIGCEILLITNNAGSLRADIPVGNLMLITDHINFQSINPLVGINDDKFGPRFVAMEDAYDVNLRKMILQLANQSNIILAQGVYMAVLGPSFETPAEIRAFRTLGADAVGMSTVPEVIVARHCDMKVVAISALSNLAAGMTQEKIDHQAVLAGAKLSVKNLTKLISAFARSLNNERH